MSRLKKFKDTIAWKGLKSIEFRGLFWLVRAAGVVVFLGYLGTSAPGAWRWAQIKTTRMHDISALEKVIQDGIAQGDMRAAEKWVLYRPRAESARIIAAFIPASGRLPPQAFLALSRRAGDVGDREEKNFWAMLARYRLRFDALRCSAPEAVEKADKIAQLVYGIGQGDLIEALPPAEEIRLTRRVLDFDARYPAENRPDQVCWLLEKMEGSGADFPPLPAAVWEQIRFNLRYRTDVSLSQAERELKEKP